MDLVPSCVKLLTNSSERIFLIVGGTMFPLRQPCGTVVQSGDHVCREKERQERIRLEGWDRYAAVSDTNVRCDYTCSHMQGYLYIL